MSFVIVYIMFVCQGYVTIAYISRTRGSVYMVYEISRQKKKKLAFTVG